MPLHKELSEQYYPEFQEPPIDARNREYRVRRIRLDEVDPAQISSWLECNRTQGTDIIHNNPEWLLRLYANEKDRVLVYLLENDRGIVGVAPFALDPITLNCQLADFHLASIPIRRLTLLGYSPSIPENEAAYGALFRQLIADRRDYDAIFLQYLKVDSYMWRFIRQHLAVHKHFQRYSRLGPMPHPLLRFGGSFEQYMQKFSSKHRGNHSRAMKRLEKKGKVELVRVTRKHQIDAYVDAMLKVSAHSWQFNTHNWGTRRESPADAKARMYWLAERGWERSYLLICGGIPCSFIDGYQYNGRYHSAAVQSDADWNDWSVGSILHLLAIKDMFTFNRPEVFDFATYAQYKLHFSTESYPEEVTMLFVKRPYPIMAKTLYQVTGAASQKGGLLLDRLNLKSKARRFLRRLGWSHSVEEQDRR
jgi:hypothetical protein